MDVICALLVLFASSSVGLATGMAPLMGSFVPVGRPQSEEEVRMLVQSAAKAFPMAPPAPAPAAAARENMYRGREGKKLARPMATRMPKKLVSTITRMPKMMKYRY